MSSKTSLPGVPFDPTETGPFDVVRSCLDRTRAFVSDNATALIIGAAVLVGVAWYAEVPLRLPRLPNWLLVGLIGSAITSGTVWVVGKSVAKSLYRPDTVFLSEQNAENGDQRIITVDPDRFEEIGVVNQNGRRRDRGFLKEVFINGIRCYEVDRYYGEENVAEASWMAGATNSEIRRSKAEIRRIKTSLEEEADKSLELLANHPDILRKHASTVANRLIRVAEDVEVVGGGALHEDLAGLLEEADPSEDLLGSDDNKRRSETGDSEAGPDGEAVDIEVSD